MVLAQVLQKQEIINETIVGYVLEIIKRNGRVTFRDMMVNLPDSIGAQDVWNALKYLQETKAIDAVKISRKKTRYKLQYAFINTNKNISPFHLDFL